MREVRVGLERDSRGVRRTRSLPRSLSPKEYRARYPERQVWSVVRTHRDNTFDLRGLDGAQLSKVAGLKPKLWKTIKPGMSVTLCWTAGGVPGQRVPYVRGISSTAFSPGCIVEGLHLQPGVNTERTGVELEAGSPPQGMRLDKLWQTEPIGDARLEYPISLCTGKIGHRLVGWVAAAWGASGSNYSPGIEKRVTAFDLLTGETLWTRSVTSLSNPQSSYPVIYLEPAYGELLVANQFATKSGPVYLERLSACTGRTIGTAGNGILVDLPTAQGLTLLADGEFLVGTVPAATTDANRWKRLQVFRRNDTEAYVPAYEIPLRLGGVGAFVGVPGGATPGYYWPEGDQALLIVHQRSGIQPIVRAQVVAWQVRSGRIEWTWDPVSALGVDQTSFLAIRGTQRAPDGSIYLLIDVDPPGPTSSSWVIKLSSSGALEQSISIDSGGRRFANFGLGLWAGGLLVHLDYNSGSVDHRPAWLPSGGGIIAEGPANWRLYSLEPCWSQSGDWLYCMFEPIASGTKLRYHLVEPGWRSLVSWEQTNGLGRDQRSTPDAGPVALLNGYVYGVNWDSVAGRWRVRRWN